MKTLFVEFYFLDFESSPQPKLNTDWLLIACIRVKVLQCVVGGFSVCVCIFDYFVNPRC